jgi:hypothetical protein
MKWTIPDIPGDWFVKQKQVRYLTVIAYQLQIFIVIVGQADNEMDNLL